MHLHAFAGLMKIYYVKAIFQLLPMCITVLPTCFSHFEFEFVSQFLEKNGSRQILFLENTLLRYKSAY